jgi:hypothetical protein
MSFTAYPAALHRISGLYIDKTFTLLFDDCAEIMQKFSSEKTVWNYGGIEPQYFDSVLADFDLKTLARLATCRS